MRIFASHKPYTQNAIKPFIGRPQIKIITGIRRSGKSTVLQLLNNELLKRGVEQEHIIFINLESFRYADLLEATKLYQFLEYLRKGGGPVIHTLDYSEESAYKVVYDIYSSVILRDTVQRYKIRDVELLERVIRYAFDNIGNTFSGKNIADYFKSQQRKIDINTVYNYLNALVGAFILHRVPRYDVKGKEILKTQEKFYVSDISLIYATMGNRDRMIAGILENIVFLELKRRGFKVYIGKLDHKEIDFVAEKNNRKIYL